ncbi:MAG: putative sensor domain DACNV-containing protein [Desulfopila sp.]
MTYNAYHLSTEYINELRLRMERLGKSVNTVEILDSILQHVGAIPSSEHLAAIIDGAFWTSFYREEDNEITVSLIFTESEKSFDTFLFDHPILFDVRNLVKLGAALENPRADIGVWPDDDGQLQIWGFKTRAEDVLIADLWIQALEPGRVLVTFGGKSLGAIIDNQGVFVDHANLMQTVIPQLSLPQAGGSDGLLEMVRYTSLLTIARAMRAHGRGGTLLIVPGNSDGWLRSIAVPVPYTGGASFLESDYDVAQKPTLLGPVTDFFSALIKKKQSSQRDKFSRVIAQIDQQCQRIARLTAVDGALVMTFDRFVYCFGAKIVRAEGQEVPTVFKVLKPYEGHTGEVVSLMDVGGTRHQSAVMFAHANPGAVAIVVSQDGGVSFFTTGSQSGALFGVQQAELVVMHEGLGAAYWDYFRVAEMNLF